MLLEACAGLLDSKTRKRLSAGSRRRDRISHQRSKEALRAVYRAPVRSRKSSSSSRRDASTPDRVSSGGGDQTEGEDIEIVELGFDEAFSMIDKVKFSTPRR